MAEEERRSMAAILPAIGQKLMGLTEGIGDDPIAWVVRTLLRFGSALLIAGLVLGTFGYFLKAAATASANNELSVLGNIGTIFSNIKTPSFTAAATGTAPLSASLQGVQNFFGDAWQGVQAAGADIAQIGSVIGTLAEDVGIGLADLAKAFLAFVMHFPDILWNGLVWGVGGAIADLLNWIFPWLVILGAALLVIGLVIWGVRTLWDHTVGAAWKNASSKWLDRRRAGAEKLFDRLFHNRPEEPILELPTRGTEPDLGIAGAPAAANASVRQTGPEEDAPEALVSLADVPEGTGAQPEAETQPAAKAAPASTVETESLPLQEPPEREELEQTLGDGYTEAKDRMRAELRKKDQEPAQALSPASSSA